MNKRLLRFLIFMIYLLTSIAMADNMNNSAVPGTSTGITYNPNSVMNPFTPQKQANTNFQTVGIISTSDTEITTAVQQKIAQDPLMAGATVRVSTKEGIVTLEGNAKSMAQVTQAANVAQSFKGVIAVNNRLSVSPANYQTGY